MSRAEERRFFFRHTLEDGRCLARTRGELSQEEIDARRYNGVKESARHLQMKEWVAQCLAADPGSGRGHRKTMVWHTDGRVAKA